MVMDERGVAGSRTDVSVDEQGRFCEVPRPKLLGRLGEDLAVRYLRKRGLEILERNWTCHGGEADIVAREDDVVALVEVKTRYSQGGEPQVMPELSVDEKKLERYRNISHYYLATHPSVRALRFSLVAINLMGPELGHIHYVPSAYRWDD